MQPHMSGIDFIKRVNEQEAFKNIPIIAVISTEHEEDSEETLHLTKGILKKPFTSGEIHAVVEKLFPQNLSGFS